MLILNQIRLRKRSVATLMLATTLVSTGGTKAKALESSDQEALSEPSEIIEFKPDYSSTESYFEIQETEFMPEFKVSQSIIPEVYVSVEAEDALPLSDDLYVGIHEANIDIFAVQTFSSNELQGVAPQDVCSIDISQLTEEQIVLAKCVYGEARGTSPEDQASVAWCIINRLESGYANSIIDIVTAPYQFVGYKSSNPVNPLQVSIVLDVLDRWEKQKTLGLSDEEAGRTIPTGYHDFRGRKQTNGTYRNEFMVSAYSNNAVWDWHFESPYNGVFPELPISLVENM